MSTRGAGILLIGLMLMVAAPASAAIENGECRNGAFPRESSSFGLAIIKGVGRAYLFDDATGCPTPSSRCKSWGYVLPGNRVITGHPWGDRVCAYFPSRGGGTAGWVDKSRLDPLAVDNRPPPSAWLGRWSDEGNPYVTITGRGSTLHVEGQSLWPGADPSKDAHVYQIDGPLTLTGDRAHYDEGDVSDCKIDFNLVGQTLVASDNGYCGGASVRFDGVYRREGR